MAIERIAYFGDSYCADAKLFYSPKGPHFPYFWPSKSYIDHLTDKTGLPIIHRGRSGHGPNFVISEFIDWLDNHKELIPTTQFIWCWSDPARTLVKSVPNCPRSHDLEYLSEPNEWQKYNQSRGVTDEQNFWHDVNHPGEIALPGPDSPFVENYYNGTLEDGRGWANAIQLHWVYVRNEQDAFRRFVATCKLFDYVVKDYDIKHIQNYRCFGYKNYIDKNGFDTTQCMPDCTFTWQGQTQTNLYDFARHPDFKYNLDNNDQQYPNHFSPAGQKAMASIIMRRMEQHL